MRNCLLHFVLLLFSIFLISITAKSQLQKIYLNPKAPGSGKQSQFVDSIRFIPLEIKEGVELGGYNNIEVTEKYFLLTDYDNEILLIYSKDGGFIKKISYKKLGEDFYPSYWGHTNQIVFFGNNKNYALTPKDEIKIKLDWNNPSNRKYFKKYVIDLNDTSFTIKKDIPYENDILRASHFYDDYYIQGHINSSPLYKDSLDYEFKIYKNNNLVKTYFPYNRISEPRFLYTERSVIFYKTDTPHIHFVIRPFCDTIYKMIKDSLVPTYQLVLPLENSLPASFFTRPFKNKTERENFERNNGWMFTQVYNFYESSRFIFFSAGYLSNYESYIYQKQGNITYKVKNIKPDSSQYNLQILTNFGISNKKGVFYKSQKASDLTSFFEQNKNVPVPKELESFLKSKPPGTTPVIIEFKLKH